MMSRTQEIVASTLWALLILGVVLVLFGVTMEIWLPLFVEFAL